VLQEHPAVAEVAVIGLPDQRWGESVTAVVVTGSDVDPNAQSAIEAELIAFARSRLAGHETPKRVIFATDLPRDFSGKLRRFKLRERYAAPVPEGPVT
jgi:acyl-coenzyme A synthetase/AMP-(fatty) acid ligase